MEISVKKDSTNDTRYCIKPIGKIDTTTAIDFGTTVNDAIDDNGIQDLVLDFSEVLYISSMGLRVLLELQKRMNTKGTMTIINAQESVLEVFKITGFDKILKVN